MPQIGKTLFNRESSWIFKPSRVQKAHAFFEKYGVKTVILARFVPIVRTFAPFVAGIGKMQYRRFVVYNIVGAAIWVTLLVPLGYFFADTEIVKQRFELVILAIVFLSVLPMLIEIGREVLKPKPATPTAD